MSTVFTGHGDAASLAASAAPTYSGFTVAAGEGVLILTIADPGSTTNTVSDGTNSYVVIPSGVSSSGFKWTAWYLPNVTAVTSGTLTVSNSASGSNNAVIWARWTGLDLSAAAEAGIGHNLTASTVSGTDNCSAGAVTATAQPALLVSIGIDLQGGALSAGTGFTSDSAFTNLPGSGFGWQGRIEEQQITDLNAHTATFTSLTTAHGVEAFAFMLKVASAADVLMSQICL